MLPVASEEGSGRPCGRVRGCNAVPARRHWNASRSSTTVSASASSAASRSRPLSSTPYTATSWRPGNGFYLEAYTKNNDHAATLVILRSGNGWFSKFGTSDLDLLDDRPNNLLFDHLTGAVDAGEADFLDLGLSGSSESYAGLRRFKAGTGAAEFPLTYLTYYPTGYDPTSGERFRSAVSGLTAALVELDADRKTVAPISESLYRYFA